MVVHQAAGLFSPSLLHSSKYFTVFRKGLSKSPVKIERVAPLQFDEFA